MNGSADSLRITGIGDYLEERTQNSSIAGYAAALVVDGEVALAAGGALRSDGVERVATTTPFHICSCSKAFTALVFTRLVEQGLTRWDAPVAAVLPELELADAWVTQHMTFRDLAGMRIGLERNGIAEWGFRPEAPVEERLRRARFMALEAPFRDRFSYSNLCYIALATAATRISGLPFQTCLQRLVFDPLELSTAGVRATAQTAVPHMPIGGRMTAVPELTGDNSQGSARVHLSAEDAARWIGAMSAACSRTVPGESGEMFACQSLVRPQVSRGLMPVSWGYGFGWSLADYRGRRVFSHGGGGRGWRALMMLDPLSRAGVMVMLAHEGEEAEALALEILELAAGRVPRPPAPSAATLAGDIAAARGTASAAVGGAKVPGIQGLYHGEVTGLVRVSQASDRQMHFSAQDAPAFDATLVALGENEFELRFDNPAMTRMPGDSVFQMRFDTGAAGDLRAISAYFGQLRRIGA